MVYGAIVTFTSWYVTAAGRDSPPLVSPLPGEAVLVDRPGLVEVLTGSGMVRRASESPGEVG
jgi:hypothetical protein